MAERTQWRLIDGRWTRSLGFRGLRVRLFQMTKDGTFYRDTWRNGRKSRRCLHTSNRAEAEKLGKALLGALARDGKEVRNEVIRLSVLWSRYQTECAAFLDNCEISRGDAAARARLLLAFFGEDFNVRLLTAEHQAAYARARKEGTISLPGGRSTRAVRDRSVEADIVLLRQMLAWALTVRTPSGRWLDHNPLAGVKRNHEKNPKRPVASYDRYLATRRAMHELRERAESDVSKKVWLKLELALVLAEATGRRLGSIRQLRWEDIDCKAARILWRAETDKKGKQWLSKIPESLAAEIQSFQRQLGAIGGLLFPSQTDATRAMDRHLFDKWLTVAEKEAGLPKLDGGLWHPYRRKWATERKGHSLKDVASAGGWSDVETLLKCYTHPDEETLLAVMSEERKLRESALLGANG